MHPLSGSLAHSRDESIHGRAAGHRARVAPVLAVPVRSNLQVGRWPTWPASVAAAPTRLSQWLARPGYKTFRCKFLELK